MPKTIIQEIQPQCDALYQAIKKEKNNQHKSNQDIADNTGIPLSSVKNFFAGNTSNPCVFTIASVCIYLGLSLDKLMGIPTEQASTDAEKQIAELKTDIRDLQKDLEISNRINKRLEKALSERKPIIICLTALCIIYTFSLLFYMVMDITHPEIGLFRETHISPLAVIIILAVIFVAVCIAHYLIATLKIHKQERDDTNE